MSKSHARLGKGLSALISPRKEQPATEPSNDIAVHGQVRQIPLEQIQPNPDQPRKKFDTSSIESLADSIRSTGVLQPVLVKQVAEERYELIVGERRWRAAKLADLEWIPAIVRSVSAAESIELALIENLQREDLNPLERAAAYREYINAHHISVDELAKRLGESRPNISNYLRLLKLTDEVQEAITNGQLAMGQARAIAGIEDKQRQLAICRLAIRRNLAVRQVEELVKSEHSPKNKPEKSEAKTRHLSEVEQALTMALGLRVKLHPGKKKNTGRVVIQYRNLEEFDLLAQKIRGRSSLE